jgi:hypothetical protein
MVACNQEPCASSLCEAGDSGGFPAAAGAKIVQAPGRGRSRVYTERSARNNGKNIASDALFARPE